MKMLADRIRDFGLLREIKAEHVLISLLTLVAYLALVVFRSLDDNKLTSWHWVFLGMDPNKLLLVLVIGIIAAYLFSKASLPERYSAPFLFISSFIIAAIFWRMPEVVVDTSRYFTQAKHLEVYGIGYFFREWGQSIVAWTDLPLIPFLYGLIFKFLGESRLYIQIFTTLLFSATVVLTYRIGETLWGEDIGLFGGLLLLGIPYIFTQIPLMLVDIPTMFFFTLAIFTFIKALDQGGAGMIIISAISIFLAFFSKYSTWLMLSVLAVIFIVYFIEERRQGRMLIERLFLFGQVRQRKILYRGVAVVLISASLIGTMVFLKLGIISEQIELLVSYQQPGLKRWGESFYSTFFFQIHPFLTLAALYSAYAALKKKDLRYAIISWLVLLVFLLQIERIRYIIMVFPMLALMASYGLQEIRDRDLRKFVALCAIVSSLTVAVFAYYPFLQRMSTVNLKSAGEYLNSIGAEDIEVFTVLSKDFIEVNPAVSVSILDLFSNQNITYRYNHPSPPWEKIQTSSLRFTWDYKNPQYYTFNNNLKENTMVVVISGAEDEVLPNKIAQRLKDYRLLKVFKTSVGIFRHQTLVKVYQPM
ncbi:MAG: glycosyltransferase family 39 protein [Actinobacteria bacterium]|nr:glycosyltransferase family 39 protein [Actinomycetota bacterium]